MNTVNVKKKLLNIVNVYVSAQLVAKLKWFQKTIQRVTDKELECDIIAENWNQIMKFKNKYNLKLSKQLNSNLMLHLIDKLTSADYEMIDEWKEKNLNIKCYSFYKNHKNIVRETLKTNLKHFKKRIRQIQTRLQKHRQKLWKKR